MRFIPFFVISLAVFLTACSQKKETAKPVQQKLPVISAGDQKAIINREISTWQFAKIKNMQGLRLILADDYLAYFGKTTMNAADVIKTFQTSTINNYRMSNIRVKPVSDDVAIVYYDLEQDITDINGDPWTPKVASASTYAKRSGQWRSVFYQETPVTSQ